MFREDYQSILALLHRVEVKGIQEANALLNLFRKVEAKAESTPPAAAAPEVTPETIKPA